jgi:hypothetical protein
MAHSRFWAGGNVDGWFVKLSCFQEVYPGHKPADVLLETFWSKDYTESETGAARAANAMADRLNAALRYADISA